MGLRVGKPPVREYTLWVESATDFPQKGPLIWKEFPWWDIIMIIEEWDGVNALYDNGDIPSQVSLLLARCMSIDAGLAHVSQTLYKLIIKILWKHILLSRSFWQSNQVIILHMSRQFSCRDMCKIMTWSDVYFSHKRNLNFHEIWFLCSKIL